MKTAWRVYVLLGLGALAGGGEEEREFRDRLGKMTVTVFPAVVRTGSAVRHDEAGAREVAEFLTARGLARATVSGEVFGRNRGRRVTPPAAAGNC